MIRRRQLAFGAAVVALLTVTFGLCAAPPAQAASAPHAGPRNIVLASKGKSGPAVSLDWAGYAVTGSLITTVSGSWTQPAATCVGKPTQSAAWVGIDGYASTDPTVQQVGTDADCTKKVKKIPSGPSYYAWFEMFPGQLVSLSTSLYPVAPGDQMSASVTLVGTAYQLVLTDAGRWTFSTVQVATTTPLNASAEWIVEAPTSCKGTKCQPVKLTDFGTVPFTGATVGGVAINASGVLPNLINMSKNKKGTILKASTSALDARGGFDVTWLRN